MNEYMEHTPSELLTLYLDGEMPPADEAAFFATVSESEELQSEIREMLAIRESVKKDTEAYTTPDKATTAVFSSLGYKAPGTLAPAATGSFWSKVWLPAATAVVASLVTTFAVLYFTGNTESEPSRAALPLKVETAQVQASDYIAESGSGIVNNKKQIPVVASSAPVSKALLPILQKEDQNARAEEAATAEEFVSINNTRHIDNQLVNCMSSIPTRTLNALSSDMHSSPKLVFDFENEPSSENFQVYIRGLGVLNTNTNSTTMQASDNITAGITFASLGNFKLGGEGNVEKIFFENDAELGKSFVWGAFTCKYENHNLKLFGFVQPFAQVSIGTGTSGMLLNSREVLGFDIYPFDSNVGIQLGLENSLIGIENTTTYSRNAVNFGITYKL